MEEDKFDIEKIREEIQKNAKVNANKNIISAYGSIDIDKLLKTVECFRKVPTIDELINQNNKLLNRLAELEKENKELKEDNDKTIKEGREAILYYTKDSIPKSVIKEKIDFYKRYGKIENSNEYVMSVEIEILEELLGE